MAARLLRISLASFLVLALEAPPPVALACGPEFSPPVMIERDYPEIPTDAYAAGQLGVVLPTYAPSYLVVAYRYFSGKPLSHTEQQQFVALSEQDPWKEEDEGLSPSDYEGSNDPNSSV